MQPLVVVNAMWSWYLTK